MGWQLTQRSSGSIQTAHCDRKWFNCFAKPHPSAELPSSTATDQNCFNPWIFLQIPQSSFPETWTFLNLDIYYNHVYHSQNSFQLYESLGEELEFYSYASVYKPLLMCLFLWEEDSSHFCRNFTIMLIRLPA